MPEPDSVWSKLVAAAKKALEKEQKQEQPTPISHPASVAYAQEPEYHGKYVSPAQLAGVYYQPVFDESPIIPPTVQATEKNSRVIGASPEYQLPPGVIGASSGQGFRVPIKDPGPDYRSPKDPVTSYLKSMAEGMRPIPEAQRVGDAIQALRRKLGDPRGSEQDDEPEIELYDDGLRHAKAMDEIDNARRRLAELGLGRSVPLPMPPPVTTDPAKSFEAAYNLEEEAKRASADAPKTRSWNSSRENTQRKRQ